MLKKIKISIIRYSFIYLFIFFVIKSNYSQTLQGNISDSNGNYLTAKILIKKSDGSGVVNEFILVQNGRFSYDLKKTYYEKGFFLDVTATGYNSHIELVKPSELKKTMNFNFILKKEKIEILEEIIIKGNKRPLSIKKDTVVYNVESFKDGTEKKVEDLLKKLPGIRVNEDTGIIKYKGITIETVTIEGDDLFDYNYTIGTKNINIDLVKEIEAIENYSENKLLKGIEKSNKVAINLKLKNNKTDLSLSTDIGIGNYSDSDNVPIDLSINSLAINKIQKSFIVSTYNNVGKNTSPFNYLDSQISLEKIKEEKFLIEKIIPELYLPKVTINNLSNINNQIFGNLNSILNISDKTKVKLNFYYLSDNNKNNQISESRITINNSAFSTLDDIHVEKKPLQYRGDFELTFNTSKSSLLEYKMSIRDEYINTETTIFSNQNNDFLSSLQSNSTFLKQELLYTKKKSDRKAIQLEAIVATNNLNQTFVIKPSIFDNTKFNQDIQDNNSKKLNSSFKALFLGRTIKNNKYRFSLGYNYNKDLFYSDLSSIQKTQVLLVPNSKNALDYINSEIYNKGSYNWSIGKFTISPKYSLRYLNLKLKQDNIHNTSNFLLFEPSLNIIYEIDRTSSFGFVSNFYNISTPLRFLYSNQVLIDNRVLRSNKPKLSLQKIKSFSLSFSKNDLFNQFEMYLGANYSINNGNFFSNLFINENSSRVSIFFLPESVGDIAFNFSLSKLIYPLKTTFRINSNYSIVNFKNVVNNSELRNNKSNFSVNSIFLKTSFNLPVNIENKTTYTFQETKSINTFSNKSIENNLKLILKPFKGFSASITHNYIIPSFKNSSNNYSFLSSKIRYTPKKKSWQLELSGVNLLNEKSFSKESATDISNNSLSVDLIERYILLNFSYSF